MSASARSTSDDDRLGLRWSIASLLLAASASIALLVIPLLTPGVTLPERGGPTTPVLTPTRQTVIESAGVGGVLLILWPVLVTAVPLLLRHRRGVRGFRALAALALLPLLPIGAFAVGGFYAPSMFTMAVSSVRRSRFGGQGGDAGDVRDRSEPPQ